MSPYWIPVLAAVALGVLFSWAFRALPGERWHTLASLPCRKGPQGRWRAINLTWYGFFVASSYVIGAATFLFLAGTANLPLWRAAPALALLLAICIPASSRIARIVDGQTHGFTVGGAAFLGILTMPLLITLLNTLPLPGDPLPWMPTLAAAVIAYAIGESLGRLACISFGCCYGKPLRDLSPGLARWFERRHFTFYGTTKKISYASALEGVRVVPIQAMTAVILAAATLLGMTLFLAGHYGIAFLITLGVTNIWRFLSECLRADWRGGGRFSSYQHMALIGFAFAVGITLAWQDELSLQPMAYQGLSLLFDPVALIALQTLWLGVFFHTGSSRTTGSEVSFVVHDRGNGGASDCSGTDATEAERHDDDPGVPHSLAG